MIEIIPSIDIMGGSCVRLSKGNYSEVKTYGNDPLSVAKKYESLGFKKLHLVDLDGAREGSVINLTVLEKIAGSTNLIIDFGGGVKTEEALHMVFNSGAAMINLGSVAVLNQSVVLEWLGKYDRNRFILSADVVNRIVAFHGWQEISNIRITDYIRSYNDHGLRMISCTDISRDGLLKGPSVKLYADLRNSFGDIFLIAGGGIADLQDIEMLENAGADAAIIGRAIFEIPGFIEKLAEKYL